ncbi:septal ring factor EnvC (AmiA/AmiB activator) [Roseiarcus fermentans]|uniref:Septal ring factor EnvC (AmiA/AmiB activator) n=1 Tax=Roseiarcus fermentans TaxID=1473586 RepID=A0A366FR82_9HYPH|nr:peptidoglycan DD-metalloendopeptidase family protein [Roseiarcus fermentans]RBP16560.1 septal ring factor EnvC (AmiA/AmiB activator) [Roseiarcus fermentans]
MRVMGTRASRYALRAAAFGAAVAFAAPALADSADPAAAERQRTDKETELRGVEDTIRASEEQRRGIQSEIDSIRTDQARLMEALIATTARVQDAERGVASADQRLSALNGRAAALVRSLQSRRGAIVEILAAVQRMGANPPPAILVRSGDMAEAVRAATLLSAMTVDLKAETERLARDIDELASTRAAIAGERDAHAQAVASLTTEKTRLAALVAARKESMSSAEAALGSQQKRAQDLANQAATLKDLIARIDAEETQRKSRERAALDAEQHAAQDIEARAEKARDIQPVRLRPEVAFSGVKGRLPMPVAGTILKDFGASDGLGGTEHGVLVSTLAGAVVSAPADGSVLYSGPYRNYGRLLIIDAGEGYYVLLAGMERTYVSRGEAVLSGEPVGVVGDGSSKMAAAAAVGAVKPVLYIELRKDGTAIDPGPWWAKTDIEKARG